MSTESQWLFEKREAVASHGMVTAMHPLAAQAGRDILQKGGNAVDAAVATAFAIGVVEPFMSGVGGVTAMVVHLAATGQDVVIDGSSMAPSAARPDMFELASPDTAAGMYGWRGTVGDAQNTGYRAPIVPGQAACLLHALERFGSGRLSRSDVMAPAIRLADEGFGVEPYTAMTTAFAMRRLRAFPETMRTFFLEDSLPLAPATSTREADRLVQPELARTLRTLASDGPSALYEGEIGERIVAHLQAHGGVLTREDFAAYCVRELTPVEISYRGYRLLGLSPTSGSMTAFEALNILSEFSPVNVHLIAEALRRAFLDRFAYLADGEQVGDLLSRDYARAIADTISAERADPDARPGRAASVASVAGGDGCTTHLNVVDADRNMVACTSTLGELFGSGVVAAGTGVVLNNGMTWFDPEPGHVNSIAPGRRTLWAPTPTLVLREGQPVMALGAPGGRRIISAVVQSLVNVLDFGLGVQEAVTRPRVHCEGRVTEVDSLVGSATIDELRDLGHDLKVQHENESSFRFARPSGILIDGENRLRGGVHQYTPAWAMGY